ncbi:hypothetical protein Taro_011368 [Colocasia esculenta]|uniref:Aminotransferase-like plant mobile domain-containing protein n=1 Tax=Colocasia esculenta TaxID=4460 RepID=A0A843U9S0_COLES|nr:hypothetical protein [Colocasia esculenta]
MERAILVGRDSMLGTCGFQYPSFPLGYSAEVHFPDAGQLGLFGTEPVHPVKEMSLAEGIWEVHGQPKTGPSFAGHALLPSGTRFAPEGYDRLCFLDRILSGEAASWYNRWSIVSSHRFRFGATEWLMGILHHYRELLDQVGIFHAVAAALHDYPYHSGFLQALAERFNRRFNTFGIAEGETCLDLWGFHRISGLPISSQFYEEVCLDDLHRDQSSYAGFYILPYSFRYLMKVWQDLARCGREQCPSASKGTVWVSCNAWVRFFYNGPFCFHNGFASDSRDPTDYLQLSVNLEDGARYFCAPRDDGWNPRQLPDRTYLAAYLVYWLNTFVLPFGEEGLIRPELIYLAAASLHVPKLPESGLPGSQQQLTWARWRLSFVPLAGQQRLDFACCSRSFWRWAEVGREGRIYRLPYSAVSSGPFRKDWLCCIRFFYFERPYYPCRFARNFGYDQAVPPDADFALAVRSYKSLDRHLVASSWWCYFTRHDPSPECFIPEQQQEGRIKEAEGARLVRTDAPTPLIASKFLRREFSTFVGRVPTLIRRKTKAQVFGPAERKAYVGALKPLVRPESSLTTSWDSGESPTVYSWWRHFLLDCGYPPDAALSAPISPGSFASDLWRAWERHIRHSIARIGPIEFIGRVESDTRLFDFWGAVVEAGEIVKIPPEKVVLPPTFSSAPCESFIRLTERQKQNASYNRKRPPAEKPVPCSRLFEGELRDLPLQLGQTPGSEDLAEATPCDDVIPPVDDDYNPTFDGTPFPDAAVLPSSFSTEQGYAPANIITGEDAEHLDATTSTVHGSISLQAIHDLLISGPETGLLGFSDFAFGIPEGGPGRKFFIVLVMAVSSTAVLPTVSPPEEGEVPRGTNGESEDTVRLIEEMMKSSPLAAIPPSATDVASTEITSRSAAIASPPPETSEPLPGILNGRETPFAGEHYCRRIS